MVQSKLQFIDNYWVRQEYGKSLKIVRIKPLVKESAVERFIAALLRSDGEAACSILNQSLGPDFADGLIKGGPADQLIALVYERVCELGLAESIAKLKTSSGACLLDVIRNETAQASLRFAVYDELFLNLVDLLHDESKEVVWLKGTALARSLYKQPYFRISVDFDLLLKSKVERILNSLQAAGFSAIWNELGHSYQLGIGPVGSLEKLVLIPSKECESFHDITLSQDNWPYVELKSDPWNRGLKARESQRFFADCQMLTWKDREFLAPSLVDHLILQLVHFHKHGFRGWHWIYDMHLLVLKVTETPQLWSEFVRRCQVEDTALSAWAGLEFLQDRLKSPVPSEVLNELSPRNDSYISRVVTYNVNPEFIWNQESLPMLLLNAMFLGDRQRKLTVIGECLRPSKLFISQYYANGKELSTGQFVALVIIHWLVLFLPGGLVRLTFGQWFWKSKGL
jgi:hypothetical protein